MHDLDGLLMSKRTRSSLRDFGGAVGAALASLLLLATSVSAGCYSQNSGAWARYTPGSATAGVYGIEDLSAATPASGHAIIHPAQILSSLSADFLGWGTAKGVGVDDCPDYYGSNWQVYMDGTSFGVYFCDQPFAQVSNTASNQTFELDYNYCVFTSSLKWVGSWNGAEKGCVGINGSTARWVSAGAESIPAGSGTQTLTVHYRSMKYHTSSGFVLWPSFTQCANDPPYYIQKVSNSDFWVKVR